MNLNMRIVKSLVAVAAACGLSLSAYAQIGSGWSSTSVSFVVQTSKGCSVSGNVFKVPSGKGRAERRYANNTDTQRQFQGTLVVNSLGGDKINVKQTFDDSKGPYNIIAVQKAGGGELYETEGGNKLASYTVGSSVKINTIITRSSGQVDVYVNGSHAETKTGGSVNLYDKCGAYVSASGTGPCTTTWTGVQFWKK
jgi:hypothetical protein